VITDWSDPIVYPMQSSVQQSNTEQADVQEQITMSFDDAEPGEVVEIPSAIQQENATSGANAEIQHFLKRPVKIYQYNWALGGTSVATFDPWYEYFNHTSIKKKIDNYYLMRCKLHLKFVINASPFHYGSLLAAYKPLAKFLTPAPISASVSDDVQNIAYSQMPRVYIYPQTSQGGEMDIPFLYFKEWLNITSATDVQNMGSVYLRPMTALQFANAGTGVGITVQVYAWADEVTISGPTVKLAMQGFLDEYKEDDGTVSGPASAIANIAGKLSGAPIIGPFATATQMLSSGVGAFAKFFGFTNVPVISSIHSFTPAPFPMFASPEIGTQIEKLTLDPKNELTIDPASLGVDLGDELLISNIVARESYITQFPWAIANSPDDILFSTAISPNYIRAVAGTQQTFIQGTPLWLASKPFTFWRGDIKVRLKFICSQYHRGRVRVSWDPVGAIGATVDSSTEVYTKIIDLAKCTDITINVPFMQDTAFLECPSSVSNFYSNDGAQTHIAGFTNGVLTVRALTDLAAPLNTADIQVLVFVSGNENLEFASPTDLDLSSNLCAYPVQSAIENYDVENDDTEMAMKPTTHSPTSYLMYQGEVVKSLRTMMRRTGFHRYLAVNSVLLTSTSTSYVQRHQFSRVPTYPGYDPNAPGTAKGLVATGSSFPYNWVRWHSISWFSQAFLGSRGAINWRANVTTKLDVCDLKAQRSTNRNILSTSKYASGNFTAAGFLTDRLLSTQIYGDDMGVSVTNTKTLTGLNFSVPYYSRFKFRTNAAGSMILGNASDNSTLDWVEVNYLLNPSADSNATTSYSGGGIELYVGAGTDYSPVFFINVPTLYKYASVPANS
jgi:hypothetical protein